MFVVKEAGKARAVAAAAAQDLNNELTIILSLVDLVITEVGPGDPLLPKLMELRQSAQRCAWKASNLLHYAVRSGAKPQPGRMEALIDG